jgi:hypothetical protein
MNEITYRRLHQALRALGFTCRIVTFEEEARLYEHPPSGAIIGLPPDPEDMAVFPHHLIGVRKAPDHFGFSDLE